MKIRKTALEILPLFLIVLILILLLLTAIVISGKETKEGIVPRNPLGNPLMVIQGIEIYRITDPQTGTICFFSLDQRNKLTLINCEEGRP